jgi:hypothetical protein
LRFGNGAVLDGSVGFDTVAVGGLSVSHREFAVQDSIAGLNGNRILSGLLVCVIWVFLGLTLTSPSAQGSAFPSLTAVHNITDGTRALSIRSFIFHRGQAEEVEKLEYVLEMNYPIGPHTVFSILGLH